MSLHLEFEPHSWYMGFAIKDDREAITEEEPWAAYIDNGDTYRVDVVTAPLLCDLKQNIREYHIKQRNGYGERIAIRIMKASK